LICLGLTTQSAQVGLIPNAAVIALLVNPDNANAATMRNDVEEAGLLRDNLDENAYCLTR
jgi:hypothetical protein